MKPAKSKLVFCGIILIICFFPWPFPAAAQTPGRYFRDDPEKPWHIAADEISYDSNNDLYIAEGDVVITKEEIRLTADAVRFDHKSMQALALGHVILTSADDILSGQRMELDLKTETGTVYDGTLFLKENHFYISGDKIQKTGKSTYAADHASISTCDGPVPAWKITGRNLQVTIEGYGTVNHVALWAKKLPVLYSPYFVFPVKLKRQSGFLSPQIGFSDRKGFQYTQPYFWAISESSDATLVFDHMEKRGEKIGTEYRYILNDRSKGTAMFDFLDDRKVDDGSRDSSEHWGYADDAAARPNSDRYWFRMKQDQDLPYDFNAKVDLDIVSDQDYLTEFKSGYAGFDETNAYFFDTYGRSLDDYLDATRVNRINLNRIWPSFSLNAETRWNDNVVYRRQEIGAAPVQQLPLISFDAAKQPILGGPLFFDLNSSYTHFFREDGSKTHRGDIYPRVYLPYRFKNYFSIEPSFGQRTTAWYADPDETETRNPDRADYRSIYDIRLDLSSDVYNVFSVNGKQTDRIKHTLRPQVVYEFTPHQDQDDHPSVDSIDIIPEKNLLTYSLINILTERSLKTNEPVPADPKKQTGSEPAYLYHQFARLKLQQSYDIKKANDDEPEPFSPISGELDFVVAKYFLLQADAGWSPYESEFLTHNVAARFSDNRNDRLFIEHRFTQGQSETVYMDMLLNITGSIAAYTSYELNVQDAKKIESRLGVIYKAQCWSLNFRYVDTETDRQFEFVISLYGLGDIGTRIAGRTIETPFN